MPTDQEGKGQRSGRGGWCKVAVYLVICAMIARRDLIPSYQQASPSRLESSTDLDDVHSSSYKDNAKSSCKPAPIRNPPKAPEGVCSLLKPGATAASIWHARLSDILDASIHPKDVNATHRGWTEQLLKYYLTPELLEKSYQAPFAPEAMKNVLEKVHRKLLNSSEPPVEIALFGGSVPQGRGCEKFFKEMVKVVGFTKRQEDGIGGKECSYPYRLQLLLDHFLGKGVVIVNNLSTGGTHTGMATAIIDYMLYPDPKSQLYKSGPDIVINAYSVNDNLPGWDRDKNITGDWLHQNNFISKAQAFLKSVRSSSPCKDPPLVVFFDDYFGNQVDVIVGEYQIHEVMEQLSFFESVAYVSFPDAMRRFVFANTDETVVSPDQWRERVEVHFGMPGHVASAWALAYSILRATLEYCEDARWDYPTDTSLIRVPQLVQREETPPVLYTKLSTYASNLTELLNNIEEKKASFCQSNSAFERPCAFAFIAGPMGTVQNGRQIDGYLNRFTVARGWRGQNDMSTGWSNKAGLQPAKGLGSTHVLRVDVKETDIKVFRIHWMKSYGEKWDGSKARFTVRILHNGTTHYETQWELEGYHDQKTSIQYPFMYDLGENKATVGSQMIFTMKLVVSNKNSHTAIS
jgi:hypothetical protein